MIIIKKLLILGALGASVLGVNAQKADAATVKRTVNHNKGVSVFTNYENAGYTGRLLKTGDEVDVYDTKTDLAGNKWIKIGEGQWIMEQYTVEAGSTETTNSYDSTGSTSQYSSTGATSSYGSAQSTSQYGSKQSTGSYGSTGATSQSASSYSSKQSTGSYGSTGSIRQSSSTRSTSSYGSAQSAHQYGSKQSTGPVSQSHSTESTQSTQSAHVGLSSSESAAKEWIAQRESGGSYTAQNGQYYGRYQLSRSYLNGDYSSANQEKVANNYVKNRYGSWSNAKSFWQTHGWY